MTDINTRRVMVERRHGWEGASPGLLARVFNVSVQRATAITNERCAACGQAICGHSDAQWSGHSASPTITIDTESEPDSYDRFFRQCHGEPGQHSNSRPPIPTGDRDGTGTARAASDVNAAAEREGIVAVKSGPVAISQVPA